MQRVGNTAAETVTILAAQLTAAEALLKSASNPSSSAKTALTDANTKLADLRRRLGLNQQGGGFGGGGGGGGFGGQQQNVRGQLGQVKGQVMGSTSMPTAQQIRAGGELREDMTKVAADVNELIAAVPAIYDALGASGVKQGSEADRPTARGAVAITRHEEREGILIKPSCLFVCFTGCRAVRIDLSPAS